jgi:recombination protein RecR
MYPESLKNLIECFKKLPGIGEKTAERLSLSVLNLDENIIDVFKNSLDSVKSKMRRCEVCNNISESNLCVICSNNLRDKSIICVVESIKNVIAIEKTNCYNGVYHVLNGLISPLDGRGPDDINLSSLIERVSNNDVKEIIMALTPGVEGETTSLYISKKLEGMNIRISKIAHGVPLGADMEYIDSLTLELALENRKSIS